MEGTYLDAVVDELNWPLFNSTPEKVREWIETNPERAAGQHVCIGRTLKYVTVAEYMAM